MYLLLTNFSIRILFACFLLFNIGDYLGRFLAGLIVYAIIALVVVALVTGTIALWVLWWLKKTAMAERGEALDSLDTTQLSAAQNVTQSLVGGVSTAKSQEEVTFFLVAAIIATIITVSPQI